MNVDLKYVRCYTLAVNIFTHRPAADLGPLQSVACSLGSTQIILQLYETRRHPQRERNGDTHKRHEDHPTISDQIEEGLDFAMLLKKASYIVAVCLVLCSHVNCELVADASNLP